MLRKNSSLAVLTLMLLGVSVLLYNVQPTKATETIYIRANGSIDPDTAPISTADNVTYTLENNVSEPIVIQRDNIIVNGAGFAVQGTGDGIGIPLFGRNNVTIMNMKIKAFYSGMAFSYSSNCNISENTITNNIGGGILLNGTSTFNSICKNYIMNNALAGIMVSDHSSNNIIFGNNLVNNTYQGVGIHYGAYNMKIVENNISRSRDGIQIEHTDNHTISGNRLENNHQGIHIRDILQTSIHHNSFINNDKQVYIGYKSGVVWDDGYPSGGNYWSDYYNTDLFSGPYQNESGSDGIGDTPYIIDEYNQDRYPLLLPKNRIMIESNTTMSNMVATGSTLEFETSGLAGSVGYADVTAPVGFNKTAISVFVDGVEITQPSLIISTNGTHYFIYFEFVQSAHDVTVQYGKDVAITSMFSKTVVGQGFSMKISLTVENQGTTTESFNITASYNNTAIIFPDGKNYTTTTIPGRNFTTITLTWDTTGLEKGKYAMKVKAIPLPDEGDLSDNVLKDIWIFIAMVGDITGPEDHPDGTCNMGDINLVADHFGQGVPLGPANCDITGPTAGVPDGKIDMRDIGLVARHFGETDP